MDRNAIDQTRTELDRAAKSAALLASVQDFAALETAWAAFLVTAGRVYTKLEQGTKTAAQSSPWWSNKVHERRSDLLLLYLWHARNVDEHTLQQIAQKQDATVRFVEPTEQDIAALHEALEGETRPWVPVALTEVVFAHVKLLDVVDRGVRYSAPQVHLGVQIADTSPANVAALALAYLGEMINEAEELAK